jgi:peroxiredoxin
MPRAARWALGGVVAAVALAFGVWLGTAQRQDAEPDAGAAAMLAQQSFKDIEGRDVALSQYRGQVVVVNFWATWCPPCREEIPGLIDVQRRLGHAGVQVVGIAVDSVVKTREYASNAGINYPVVFAGMEALDLVRALGNKAGALPFTVVLDRAGRVAVTHLGLMSVAQIEAAIGAAQR